MAVKITEQMYDTFTNNGYTEDDIKNTVNHYREQGMPDSAIFTNLNKKNRELAGIKDFNTPQISDQPNYDTILNDPSLTPQQQAEQIKQKGEAYRAGLDKELAGQKAKILTGGAIKIASPLVGLGLAPFTGGMSLPASMAVTGAAEGATFGLGEALQNQKTGADFAKDVAAQGLLGGVLGAGTGALFRGARKVFPRAITKVQDSVGFIANKIADDIDPNWSMSDDAMNTVGSKVFNAVKNNLENKQPIPNAQQLGLDDIQYEQILKQLPTDTARPIGLSRLPKENIQEVAPTVTKTPTGETQLNVGLQAIEQPQAPQPQVKQLPPLNDNYLKDLSQYTPTLHREMSPAQAMKFIGNINTDMTPENLYFSNKPELALGQGANKGILVELDSKGIQGQVNTNKPLWESQYQQGNAEFISKLTPQSVYRQNVKSITIKPDAKFTTIESRVIKNSLKDWTKVVNEDGSITFIKPQVNVPEMVQPQIQVPQRQTKTRGGIKTVGKGFGEDVAKAVSDTDYTTRGLKVNQAEFANLSPEQQADLINTDDISDLSIYAKQQNLKSKLNAGEDFQKDLNKYVKQGTQQGQAFQARMAENINTPLGALTATQSTIRQATPKRINDIIDNADNIVEAVTTARTSVAKVDNLNNALKGTVKNERKYLVDRILKLDAEGQLTSDNVIKLINKKYNIPEITQNDLTKIQELTTNISNAKTERDVQVTKGLLRKFMVDKVPKTLRNKVNTYRYINMLLSPKSRTKDFVFTTLFQGEQAIDEAFAQLPALASRVFKGINTRGGVQPKAWVGGLKKGFAEGVQDVKLGIETGRAGEGTRFDLPRGQQFAYTPLKEIGVEPNVIKKIAMAGESVLSKLEKALNYTIRVPDRMFYEAKYASSIADQLKAAKVKEPTSEMIEQAVKEAKDAVYQGDTWASRVSLGARDLLNKLPTGPLKVGDIEMPFVQTIANITEEGLKNVGGLPVGLTKWAAGKTPTELRDAELLIGKGLKSLGYLGVGGAIAGGAIKSNIGDLSKSTEYENAITGMQPQSVVIGNKAFSLANAPNVTIPIGIYRSLLEQGTPQERAARAAMTAMSAIGDMPAFQTLGDLSKGVGQIAGDLAQEDLQGAQESAVQMGNQQIANITGQFVPLTGALGNIRNIVDPYSREQYTQDLGQYIGNKTINRIPFASQSLPMRYGITGEPVMMTNIKNPIARTVGELVDPFSIRNYTPNPTIDRMTSLTKQAEGVKGNKAFNIKKAKRSIDINGERIKLNPKQYSEYQKDYGKINYYLRQKALKSENFNSMDNEEKVKYMRDLNSSIDQAVKSVLFGHSPKKQARYTQDILDNYDTFTK